jgi:hypothetical protein
MLTAIFDQRAAATTDRRIHRLIVACVLLSVGCSPQERRSEDVTAFFAKGAKVASSPDAGLYKHAALSDEWDHVATVHGMIDDMAFCDTVVNALKAKFPNERYACRMLNQ